MIVGAERRRRHTAVAWLMAGEHSQEHHRNVLTHPLSAVMNMSELAFDVLFLYYYKSACENDSFIYCNCSNKWHIYINPSVRPQMAGRAHKSSPKYVTVSTPTPLLTVLISSVVSIVIPMPIACSFPSECMATGFPLGIADSVGGRKPPAEVNPGHIMCAPASRKRIAPRSTLTMGSIYGSDFIMSYLLCPRYLCSHLCNSLNVG